MLLISPIILMWCGVAYWFGFASEVILKTAFPAPMAPVAFLALLSTAVVWTLWNRRRIPRRDRDVRRTDSVILAFLGFSVLLVIGQIMGM